MESNKEETRDLRNKKRAGRQSVTERSALSVREALAKDVVYLSLKELKSSIPGASIMELCNIIKTGTSIIQDEKTSDEDVTIDVLIRKYHDVSVRIQEARQTPETIVDET